MALFEVEAKLHVKLSPAYLGNLQAGIFDQLNKSLLKHIDDLGGVVLSYDHVRVLSKHASIHNDDPFLYVPISLSTLMFAPTVGDKLEAVVTRHGRDHLALLVYGLFNASTSARKIPRSVKYVPGQTVIFAVDSLKIHGRILSLEGHLCEGPAVAATTPSKLMNIASADSLTTNRATKAKKRRTEL
mmetsp:Transcript_42332/g.92785  ORF Transcript_42332/g.92785 Transcript_42332/m.92785 type:complete len:186 (-) Transcript_42332:117-674(-)